MVDETAALTASTCGAIVPEEEGKPIVARGLAEILEVVFTEGFSPVVGTVYVAELTDIYRYATVNITLLNLRELITDGCFIVAGIFSGLISSVSPLGVFVLERIFIRLVAVDRHHDASGRIVGQDKVLGQIDIGTVGWYAEPTSGIIATCGAHSIDKHLLPVIEDGILLAAVGAVGTPTPSAVVNLIHRLEI